MSGIEANEFKETLTIFITWQCLTLTHTGLEKISLAKNRYSLISKSQTQR